MARCCESNQRLSPLSNGKLAQPTGRVPKIVERPDYFLRRPRMINTAPAINATALPADTGLISGTVA